MRDDLRSKKEKQFPGRKKSDWTKDGLKRPKKLIIFPEKNRRDGVQFPNRTPVEEDGD